jgi:hypothetical protein
MSDDKAELLKRIASCMMDRVKGCGKHMLVQLCMTARHAAEATSTLVVSIYVVKRSSA